MRAFGLLATVFALCALPALAARGIALVPQDVGARGHYRVVRMTQSLNGPLTATLDFSLIRRNATTMVLERTGPGGAPNDAILAVAPDGTLTLNESGAAAAADADLTDVLTGLNLAIAAAREGDGVGHDPWPATLLLGSSGAASAQLMLAPTNLVGSSYDFSGGGQALAQAQPSPQQSSASGPTRRRGGYGGVPGGSYGGGGFPGAGNGAGGGYPGGAARQRPPASGGSGAGMTAFFHVDGHANADRLARITITETRTVTIENQPFTNVGSWTISALD